MADSEVEILRTVLDRWRSAVDAHEPDRVASVFAEDAIFQGLRPYVVGRDGIAAYYAAQPLGLTAAYEIRESRRLAADVVLGYLEVEFGFADRSTLTVHLGVVARRIGDAWLIGHYQVSQLD
ncbi:SgcJ/EcaC family oxidoreductase [Micromonospora sp. CA-249363]|uniref:SgcJ/EcaC family oxidoreductase n=1 Tax=Micromonospora sp. CA-249363 TaxID=3239963 RepID=UPI003D92B8C5